MISTRNSLSSTVVIYLIGLSLCLRCRLQGAPQKATPGARVLSMHSFPAADPFPVACVALIAVDNVGGAFGLSVRHQGSQDGSRLHMNIFALAGIIHREAFFDKARIVLPTHETM